MKKALTTFSAALLSLMVNAQFQNGLEAGFTFNGNYTDQSSNGITGTNYGTSFGTDHQGNPSSALTFSPSSYYSFNNNGAKPSFPLTISAWVRLDNINLSLPVFFSDNEPGNYNGYWLNSIAGTGQMGINFGDGGVTTSSSRRTYVSDVALTQGVWYHVVAMINEFDDMRIYIDCELTTGSYNGAGSQTMVYSNTESRIGSSINNGGQYMIGSVDELMIWDRLLTTQELDTICSSYLDLKKPAPGNLLNVSVGQDIDNGLVFIETPEKGEFDITLYDLAGKALLTTSMQNGKAELNISGFPKQLLLLEIKDDTQRTLKKVVAN